MIKLTKEEITELLGTDNGIALPRNFWKDVYGDEGLYFITNGAKSDYEGVKLIELENSYSLVPVELTLEFVEDGDKLVEKVEVEAPLTNNDDIFYSLALFFKYMDECSYTKNIVPVLLKHIDDDYYYSNTDNTFELQILDTFSLEGDLIVGNYGGLMLTDLQLINRHTDEIIRRFNDKQLEGIIEVLENEDEIELMASYLESLNPYDAKEIAESILKGEI